MISPSKIPGLKIWIDAADDSTVNNGRVTNGQNVFKIVDKSSGYVFRNGYGVNGPSYSVGIINGKNAITFNYYTSSDINSILTKGLWAGNVTPMASGTYSLYFVSFPYDNRQRNTNGSGTPSQQVCWLFSLTNLLTDGSKEALNNYEPNKSYVFFSPGPTGLTNSFPLYKEETDFTFPSTSRVWDKLNQSLPNNNSLDKSDKRYIYGKTNIIGVRASDNLKRLTIIRENYVSDENFQSRIASGLSRTPNQGFTPLGGGPWLTIGGLLPNSNNRIVDGVAGPLLADTPLISTTNASPFEGHFCEFLFWDRVLERSEANSVESYLKRKWTG
jgi:hypothetical protein